MAELSATVAVNGYAGAWPSVKSLEIIRYGFDTVVGHPAGDITHDAVAGRWRVPLP